MANFRDRTPVRRITAYRDQYVMGVRTMVPISCYEFSNGDILEGKERCQFVLEGDPFDDDDGLVKRCEEGAEYISRRYHHSLCASHKMEEDNITKEQLPI